MASAASGLKNMAKNGVAAGAGAAAARPPPSANTIEGQSLGNDIASSFQSFAAHSRLEFDEIRDSIKQTSNMFMFGEPQPQMMSLIMKLYHENLLRIIHKSNFASNSAQYKILNLSCMFGILQTIDDELYVTISEAPAIDETVNFPTDKDYKAKKKLVLTLLRDANVEIEFPEEPIYENETDKKACPVHLKNEIYTDDTNHRDTGSSKDWRTGDAKAWPLKDYNDKSTFKPETNEKLRGIVLGKIGEEGKNSVYDSTIRELPITVKYVDSCEYLKHRRVGDPTFRPFKKYDIDKGVWKSACNNGHLCTESKLFAYASYNGLKVKSFVAYWIGNNLPNVPCTIGKVKNPEGCHVIESYCYGPGERAQMNSLIDQCSSKVPKMFEDLSNFRIVFPYILRPMAVVCPGCFANIRNYMTGTMTYWNASNCYYPRRGLLPAGGRRSKKALRNRRKRRTTRRR